MRYTILGPNTDAERDLAAGNLGEALQQTDAPWRAVAVGSGQQRMVVLRALNPLPASLDRKLLVSLFGDKSLAVCRLLVKQGMVEGEASAFGLKVDMNSLLRWAERQVREFRVTALPLLAAAGEEADPDTPDQPEAVDEPLLLCEPRIPEREWTAEQLAELWSRELVPCGEEDDYLLLAPLAWCDDCANRDEEGISRLLGTPCRLMCLASNPDQHAAIAREWWDRFWQCDENGYAGRTIGLPAATDEEDDGRFYPAIWLIRAALDTVLHQDALLAPPDSMPAMAGDDGQLLMAAYLILHQIVDSEGGAATLSMVRQANELGLELVVENKGERGSPQFMGSPFEGLAERFIVGVGVAAGLSLTEWEEENEGLLLLGGTRMLTVRAKRSLNAVYGPTLELAWSEAKGGLLADEGAGHAAPRPAAGDRPRRAPLFRSWVPYLQDRALLFMVLGVLCGLVAVVNPERHGAAFAVPLLVLGSTTAAFDRKQVAEPGTWMASVLFLALYLPVFAVGSWLFVGAIRNLPSDWLWALEGCPAMALLFVELVFLWRVMIDNFRLSRKLRAAVMSSGQRASH
jgi:hypothetical protein